MHAIRRKLLATAAGLTIAFAGATGAIAQEKKGPAPIDLATVTADYHTKDSKALADLEARMNAERPAGMPRIVYIDPDVMMVLLSSNGDPRAFGGMMVDYLASKKAPMPDVKTLASITIAAAGQEPGAAVPQFGNPAAVKQGLGDKVCIVTPYDPNSSAESYMQRAFALSNPQTGKSFEGIEGVKLNISFTRAEMEEIVNAREAWGCFDTVYAPQVNQSKDFGQILALHRVEVFKDLGGLMQAVKDGDNTDAIAKFADFRETVAAVTATPRGQLFTSDDAPFYGAVIDDTGPALRELRTRIDAMGVEKFRKLPAAEMIKMANDIVEKKALTETEATHIIGVSMLGANYFHSLEIAKAPASEIEAAKQTVTDALKRQNDAAERSLREMSPEEMVASAPTPVLTVQDMYFYMQNQIFGDPKVQKNPDDPAARLSVHQQLLDKTRAMLDAHPEQAGVIHQVLRGIFLSNPMMEKAPPPKAPPPKSVNMT